MNFRYTTAAFTLSPESGASLCCANSPGDWALYAVSVRRLIALHSGLPLPLVTLACGSPYASLQPFRPFLTETPLPSANTFVNVLKTLILTGFTYRGLPPHKFTPMPGVHNLIHSDVSSAGAPLTPVIQRVICQSSKGKIYAKSRPTS